MLGLRRWMSTTGKDIVTDKVIPQTSNRLARWSQSQRPKVEVLQGARFAQIDVGAQPNPPAAIEFIREDPVHKVPSRTVSCNGDGPLGHPKVFINLDNSLVASCGYCGRKFQKHDH